MWWVQVLNSREKSLRRMRGQISSISKGIEWWCLFSYQKLHSCQKSLPPLSKIFNMIIQEQNHKRVMIKHESKEENASLFVITIPKLVQSQSERPTCKRNEKLGHEEANCFKLIGWRTGWVARGGWRGQRRGHARGGQGDLGGDNVTEARWLHIWCRGRSKFSGN